MANSTLNNKEIVVQGDPATCGHTAVSINPTNAPTLNGLPIILTTSDLVDDGVILPSFTHTATINNLIIAVDGDQVTNHGSSPHDNASIIAV